ncbi:MAG TPA: hypothetical protein VID72_14135, partial [Ktedonobacterales bacterium]
WFIHCHGLARFFPGLPLAQYSTRHIPAQGAWAGRRVPRSGKVGRSILPAIAPFAPVRQS